MIIIKPLKVWDKIKYFRDCKHSQTYFSTVEQNFYAWTIFAFQYVVKYLQSYNFSILGSALVIYDHFQNKRTSTCANDSIAKILNSQSNSVLQYTVHSFSELNAHDIDELKVAISSWGTKDTGDTEPWFLSMYPLQVHHILTASDLHIYTIYLLHQTYISTPCTYCIRLTYLHHILTASDLHIYTIYLLHQTYISTPCTYCIRLTYLQLELAYLGRTRKGGK